MIQQKNFLIYPHKQQFRLELNQQKSLEAKINDIKKEKDQYFDRMNYLNRE